MGRYILRRVLQAIPLLLLLSIGMFLLIHALPGGPEQVIFNPRLSDAGRAALRARFGLDQPLPVQYLRWLLNSLTGDFGYSYLNNQPVGGIIAQRFPATLTLFIVAFALALVTAIFFGVVSALRQNSVIDYTLTTLAYFGVAMPAFILGLLLQDLFGVQMHMLPVSGTETLGLSFDFYNTVLDRFLHMILPTLTLSVLFMAGWSRYMRASTIEVVKQDYMRTARAKGVSSAAMLWRHAIRNAAIPLITVVAIDFGSVAAGATITEGIFAWPGMGQLFLNSLTSRDYPVLLATLMLSGTAVVLFNLIADVLYGVMDPRIRYS
ncbi:MAG: ABC transporter permease [Ktedonobacteraceae bacterium]|nr:ABC transporter permease [Ktedonobacteraceae bacterium]MBO0790276.1 ABC transporter permease [Ktedonobacteraceae bacterium]